MEEQLLLAKNDLISFGKLFLPDDFMRSESPFFHYQVCDALNDLDVRQLAVILPRGHGKTVLTKCSIVHDFVFTESPLFYGWVAASSKISVPNLDYVKYHLEYNDRIRYYFGDLKGKKWTEDDIELKNGCKLISKSNLSGIRGGAKLHKRYDLIILDDFEDENNTVTPESRSKIANLVTAVVFPALEPGTGRLRINGTPVHFDAFITNILAGHEKAKTKGEDYSWKVITYKALQDDGTPLWPSWFGHKEMERKKKFYADSGQPQKFYQEYMMEVQSDEDAIFTGIKKAVLIILERLKGMSGLLTFSWVSILLQIVLVGTVIFLCYSLWVLMLTIIAMSLIIYGSGLYLYLVYQAILKKELLTICSTTMKYMDRTYSALKTLLCQNQSSNRLMQKCEDVMTLLSSILQKNRVLGCLKGIEYKKYWHKGFQLAQSISKRISTICKGK
jgi:hypothetical protein